MSKHELEILMLDPAQSIVRRASAVIQAPFGADLGSPPSPIPDVPVAAVFLVLFFAGFVVNLLLFWRDRNKEHHFLISLALAGMCYTLLAGFKLLTAPSFLPLQSDINSSSYRLVL